MYTRFSSATFHGLLLAAGVLIGGNCLAEPFSYDQGALPGAKPWTSAEFQNNPEEFQFVVIGDRTGGANVQKTFEMAIGQLNLLQPEFVINVGDIIEGYSDDKAELNAEWDEVDVMLNKLDMPFFRTLGNHDIANDVATEVLARPARRHAIIPSSTDTLFIVLDSEDPPRTPPEGIREKLDVYNRLQTEDPRRHRPCWPSSWRTNRSSPDLVSPSISVTSRLPGSRTPWRKTPTCVGPSCPARPCLGEPVGELQGDSASAQGAQPHVPAGHLHYYDYDNIDGHEHITMGPAGAPFTRKAPATWITSCG